MKHLLIFSCVVILFNKTLESDLSDFGIRLTAALMNPMLIGHQVNFPTPQTSQHEGLMKRPATPRVPSNMIRLSPIKKEVDKKRRSRSEDELVLINHPLTFAEKSRSNILPPIGKAKISSPRIIFEAYYEFLKESILFSNYDDVIDLLEDPKLNKLTGHELMDLLDSAYARNKNRNVPKGIFRNVFEKIVGEIVPKYHPEEIMNCILLAFRSSVPRTLFPIAAQHVNLLSPSDLDKIIGKLEEKYIWQNIQRIGMSDIKRFNFYLIEIASKLHNCGKIVELPNVKMAMERPRNDNLGSVHLDNLSKIQFIYITTKFLDALKSIEPFKEEASEISEIIRGLIEKLFNVVSKELNLSSDIVLEFIEPVMRVVLEAITEEQEKPIGKVMSIIHEILLKRNDLPRIYTNMEGFEDLHYYVRYGLISLTQARLKYYRNYRLTKSKLLSLMNSAEFSIRKNVNLLLLILGSTKIDPNEITEEDVKNLGYKSKVLLKTLLTFPESYKDELCTADLSEKESVNVIWNLPEDLFVSDESLYPYKSYLLLIDTIMNLPKLFLYRVFGLPLHGFAEIYNETDEFPEMHELIDISNFFLERWCSIQGEGSYPIVKVISGIKV